MLMKLFKAFPYCRPISLATAGELVPAASLRVRQRTFVLLLLVGAFGGGYGMRSLHEDYTAPVAVDGVPPLEFFITRQSFSETENAKTALEAMCARFQAAVRARVLKGRYENDRRDLSPDVLARAIRDLESGAKQFEGTGQELVLTADLLRDLRAAGRLERWIDVYLKTVYAHPMHPLAGDFASEAILVAKSVGREPEVIQALNHVGSIPLEFETRHRVAAVLSCTNRPPLSPSNHVPVLTIQ